MASPPILIFVLAAEDEEDEEGAEEVVDAYSTVSDYQTHKSAFVAYLCWCRSRSRQHTAAS